MKKQSLLFASLLISMSAVPVFASDAPKDAINKDAMQQASPMQKDVKKDAMTKPASAMSDKKSDAMKQGTMKQDSMKQGVAPAPDTNKSMMYKY